MLYMIPVGHNRDSLICYLMDQCMYHKSFRHEQVPLLSCSAVQCLSQGIFQSLARFSPLAISGSGSRFTPLSFSSLVKSMSPILAHFV